MPTTFTASTNIVRHAANETTTIFPGVTQQIIVGPATGSGGITAELMEIAPGMCLPPHTHPVEEAITILHGDVRVRVGHEQIEVRGADSHSSGRRTSFTQSAILALSRLS